MLPLYNDSGTKMKVLLLSFNCNGPEIGLGYIASQLKNKGFLPLIVDGRFSLSLKKIIEIIKDNKISALGIRIYSKDVGITKKLTEILRKNFKELIIFGGGPHPSCEPEKIFERIPELSFAVKGEGEYSIPLALNSYYNRESLKSIPNIIWKKDSKTIINRINFIKDLSSLEFPSWELIDPRSYPVFGQGLLVKKGTVAPIVATRGCPYNCKFCTVKLIHGNTIRFREPDNIIDEIKYLYKNFNVKEFHFIDDNFTLNREFVIKVCEKINSLPFKITWAIPQGVRPDSLDRELLQIMKKSGCWAIGMGIESASDRILKMMNKKETVKLMQEKIKLVKETKIISFGYFITGFPSETKEEREKTISFACSSGLDSVTFNIFKAFPGTGLNYSEEYLHFDYDSSSSKDLKNTKIKAMIKFYSNPFRLINFLKKINILIQLSSLFERLLSVFLGFKKNTLPGL